MHKRRIELEDGRYLILYTFDEPRTDESLDARREEPAPAPSQPESKRGDE
jgi:hypothetical protein